MLKKLDIMVQTCQGLGYAHANGIVHRDIKTANIRLLENGEVKIMDFGIAKMTASHFTRTGMIMGTPHYMAPEQIRGEKVDGRADIFSLGVVLFELLVYRKPFAGDNPTTVLFKIIHEPPESLVDAPFTPPEGLVDVVMKAIAKKPQDRYQTCEEFAEDLRYIYAFVQQQAIRCRNNASFQPDRKWVIRLLRCRPCGEGRGPVRPHLLEAARLCRALPFPGQTLRSRLPSQQKAASPTQQLLNRGDAPANETSIQSPTQATVAQPGVRTELDSALAQAGRICLRSPLHRFLRR